jgi:hypothetical protein
MKCMKFYLLIFKQLSRVRGAESFFISKNHCLSQNSLSFIAPYGLLIKILGHTNSARDFQLVNLVRVQ